MPQTNSTSPWYLKYRGFFCFPSIDGRYFLIISYIFLVCFSVPHSRSKKILIPAALISRVIGRGGCNVNAIREHTAALIDIDTNRKKANGDCMVTIKWEFYYFYAKQIPLRVTKLKSFNCTWLDLFLRYYGKRRKLFPCKNPCL